MNSEAMVDRLLESDVLCEAGDGSLALTSTFQDRIDRHDTALDGRSWEEIEQDVTDALSTTEARQFVLDVGREDPGVIADLLALVEVLDGVREEDLIRILPLLEQYRYEPTEDEGVPTAFSPISGDYLARFMPIYSRAIAYVWRHDCESCDVVRDDLDEFFERPPDDIGLFAVYGPDSPEVLHEECDVVGAPTTLFIKDGRIDTRLLGAPAHGVIEKEIEKLRR